MKRSHAWSSLVIAGIFLMGVSVQMGLAASQTAKTAVQQTQIDTSKKPVTKVKGPAVMKKTTPPVPKGPGDPDLAAELISASPMGTDRIQIIGRITNIGGSDFVSGPNQAAGQIVLLLPHLSGPDSVPVIRNVPITRLNSGQSMTINASFAARDYFPDFLHWGSSTRVANECPANIRATFIVWVSYDPDLHDDGNEQNDDGNHDNDEDRAAAPVSRFGYMADCPG